MNFNTTIKLTDLAGQGIRKLPFLTSALLIQNSFGGMKMSGFNNDDGGEFKLQSAVNESDIGLSFTDGFFPSFDGEEL
jgi:hypothetical protein